MHRPSNRISIAFVARSVALAGGLGLLALAGVADADPPPPCEHHHGPPPEAFTACDGKASGDACTVSHHDFVLHGACGAPHGETSLFCVPDGPPPPPPDGPPPNDG
jgi:hypothetical protein